MTIQKTIVLNFQSFEGIRSLPFPPYPLQKKLRNALSYRIRHRKAILRRYLRTLRWSKRALEVIRQNILDRAAQTPLFPMLLENFIVGEVES